MTDALETRETLDALRRAVSYDPATGVLTWNRRPDDEFVSYRMACVWNGTYAGKPVKKRTRGYVIVVLTQKGVAQYFQGHRVAWALHYNFWPHLQIDHRNGVRDDNRLDNLREASHAQNQLNRGTRHGSIRSNKSGYRGVYLVKSSGKWRAQIQRGTYRKVLGEFDDPHDAHLAYEAKARELDGAFHYQGAAA